MFLSDAVKEKHVWGTFKKYTYACNGDINRTVWCRSDEDFEKLLSLWNKQSVTFCKSKYLYGFVRIDPTSKTVDEILSDYTSPDLWTLRQYLTCPYTRVDYIQ